MHRLSKACVTSLALSFWKSMLAAGLLTAPSCPAFADIITTGGENGLGTRLERNAIIQVKDGTIRGRNRFHRFNKFDTRDERINAVEFVNTGTPNVFMGVLNRAFINKPISLTETGNLYVLSPRGITVGPGSSFLNVNTLMLSTAAKFQLGNSLFDFDSITDLRGDDFSLEPATQPLGPSGILSENLANGDTDLGIFESQETFGVSAVIEIQEGVNLSVDQSLLIAANHSPVKISNSQIKAESSAPNHGLVILGADISVDELSKLDSNNQVVLLSDFNSPLPTPVPVLVDEPEPELEPVPEPIPELVPAPHIFPVVPESKPENNVGNEQNYNQGNLFSFETFSLSLRQVTVTTDNSSSLGISSDLNIEQLEEIIDIGCLTNDIEPGKRRGLKCDNSAI